MLTVGRLCSTPTFPLMRRFVPVTYTYYLHAVHWHNYRLYFGTDLKLGLLVGTNMLYRI